MEEPQYPIHIPEIVALAKRSAVRLGFDLRPEGNTAGSSPASPSCCTDAAGRLLMTLASTVRQGLIGEIGTGAGVGTAWLQAGIEQIESGTPPNSSVRILSVESNQRLAIAAKAIFANYTSIEILHQDWKEHFQTQGPFALLFADGGDVASLKKNWKIATQMLKPGGILVLDDVTPEAQWPETWRNKPDPKRELAFNSGNFQSTEVMVTPTSSVLLLVRR